MAEWQLQEAKNKFSHVVDKALREGPQFVTRHGKRSVVVLSIEEFEKKFPYRPDLKTFLLSSPGDDLDLERSQDSSRNIDI